MTTGIIAFIVWTCYPTLAADNVKINEICSNNFSAVRDPEGNYSDYIELYNSSPLEVSMDGYYLSDDEKDLQKYSLDDVRIPAGGYYLIWTGGTEDSSGEDSFGISSKGEKIVLCNHNCEIMDSVNVPELAYNSCYGREADGEEWKRMTGTPGSTNAGADIFREEVLKTPILGKPSGFYAESFELTISASEDEQIYYTLDGSEPTPESLLYEGALKITDISQQKNVLAARTDLSPNRDYAPGFNVDKATVVRARSYNEKTGAVSKSVTGVYFVGYEEKAEYSDMPVISLVVEPDALFDAEYGIYGNGIKLEEYKANGGMKDGQLLSEYVDEEGETHYLYMASNAFNSGKEWECEAVLSMFDETHNLCFTQNVGIRISGESTRKAEQKSLNIFGRDIYDDSVVLPYTFFEGTKYSSIKLRNGGSDYANSKIKDAFIQQLAEGRNVAIQRSCPCIVFLNGEYWGIYNIRERYKEEYLENHCDVNGSNVWVIKSGSVNVGTEEGNNEYQEMLSYISENDMSVEDNYYVACWMADLQSLIDYYCINLYVDNRDMSFKQNMSLWRTIKPENSEYGDCRWRWMLYDMDISLNQYDSNTFAYSPSRAKGTLMEEPVISSLLKNSSFREQFCTTFMDLANSIFEYGSVHSQLEEWKEVYRSQTVKSHQRFLREDFTEDEFEGYIQNMDDFFKNRFAFVSGYLAEEFDLTGELESVNVSLNLPEGGSVMVNSVELDENGKYKGQYFRDYPVSLTAEPAEGYRFIRWSGDVMSEELALKVDIPEGGLHIQAVFEKMETE